MADAAGWYYSVKGRREGPITTADLKQLAAAGKLGPDDLVWRDGMAEWKPASKAKGLFPPPPPRTGPPDLPPAGGPPPLPAAPSINFGAHATSAVAAAKSWWGRLTQRQRAYVGAGGVVGVLMLIGATAGSPSQGAGRVDVSSGSKSAAGEGGGGNSAGRSAGSKLEAFKACVAKLEKMPRPSTEAHNRQLQMLIENFRSVSFDPKAQAKEAKQIADLFDRKVKGRYSGQLVNELEGAVVELVGGAMD